MRQYQQSKIMHQKGMHQMALQGFQLNLKVNLLMKGLDQEENKKQVR